MKRYKTEIILNKEQEQKYNKTIGVCRFVYNLFLDKNKELSKEVDSTGKHKFINAYGFGVWLNNDYISNHPEYNWMKEISSKSKQKAILNAEYAYKRFFKKQTNFPKYKKKDKNDCSMYFVRNNKNTIIQCERHRIKIPTLGWCRIKEKGFIPTNKTIRSGTISKTAGRYYVSVLVDEEIPISHHNKNSGIGIDLGVKDLAILSNGTRYRPLKLKKLEKKLKQKQRAFSRKCRQNGKDNKILHKNIAKQRLVIQKIYQRITNIRNDYQNKVIQDIIKQEPSFIAIEDLNIKGMMRNRHLSKAIQDQGLYQFVEKLKYKCKVNGIELRQVDRYFPSSKICSVCGLIKKDLKLNDRTYKCECGNIIDRDLNASINLMNAKEYRVIV